MYNMKHVYGAYRDVVRHARGHFGESVCAHILQCRGYKILARNYKVIGGEVDIICCKEYNLIFVEVKTWEYYTEDDIVSSVNIRKLSHIEACANTYIADEGILHTGTCVRVDVMLVMLSRHTVVHYKGVL